MKKARITVIISAPSGTGKTTICNNLRGKSPNLKHTVSHTTRLPRPEEKDGEDYFFISEEQFKKKIAREEFFEWAQVYHNYYGTSLETIKRQQKNGSNILLELDVQGVESLRKVNFNGVFIFILPPSIEEMAARLKKRGTESQEKIEKRISVGKEEISKYHLYDYVLTNDEVDKTTAVILSIITAETCRASLYNPTSPDIQELLKRRIEK